LEVDTSGVQDPGFVVQSGRILGIFWIRIGLDIVSPSTGSGTGLSNEINCGHRKNLKWINSFMKKKYTISKWYWLTLPLGILTFRLTKRTSQLSFKPGP